MSAPLVELRRVSKSFGATRALDDVTFAVHAGEIHVLGNLALDAADPMSIVLQGDEPVVIERGVERAHELAHERDQDLALRLEVIVDQAGRQARGPGDPGHARPLVTLARHDREQPVHDLGAA